MTLTTLEIDNEVLVQAHIYGEAQNRNTEQQIQYWIHIGKIAQDNPDLNFSDISDILNSIAQVKAGATTPYKFG
ncbi:TA system antitoxin ParD family protein [Acinetobacter sp. ANC 3813]|uniref:TA system antitoxin ParD family protein n=1 Tax=Acinetobacter sp. ANC 3813 TaxID=1977873 RepID=UPI000A33F7EA|nr:hypothetical protein [Acinetobacter sp. ANC 3813]OTG86544.1 hypothetical protein B9T34_17725 [Acinetobacter sp. ANC 3813]